MFVAATRSVKGIGLVLRNVYRCILFVCQKELQHEGTFFFAEPERSHGYAEILQYHLDLLFP